MAAKDTLLTRLNTIEQALQLNQLINQANINVQHNNIATLLRKGLGIVAFNILEDYIKERTVEMFKFIPSSLISFSNLPSDFQEAATIGALRALIGKVVTTKKNKENWLDLIQTEASHINSTSLVNGYTISELSLMSENSNIYSDDIPKALKCLNIEGGWNTLQRVSGEIYGGVPNLNQSYTNISSRRHRAAHVAGFDYEYGWLESAPSEIRAIASSFDISLAYGCRKIRSSPANPIQKDDLKNGLLFRFLVQSTKVDEYHEKVNVSSRTIKKWSDYQTAIQNLVPKCQRKNEFLVVLNTQHRIIDWHC